MTVRLPRLVALPPADLLRSAERILAHPTCARASLNEVYTFALATTQLAEIAVLAAAHVTGTAGADQRARLRDHLLALGVLPATFTLSTEEPNDGQG